MKPNRVRIFFILIALVLFCSFTANATHLRAGEITVRRDACNSLKFWITVTVFTNTINTNVLFGGEDDILDFGDGSDPDGDGVPGILVPETQNTLRPDLGEGIATASYTIAHVYPAFSTYLISYSEPNRNEGVVNMDGSVNTRFYIETEISVDPFLGCNPNTPSLAVPPIDRGCTGVAWFHNPGAFDLDGDSLSYRLVIPNRERNTTVNNYRAPNHTSFYADFQTGNEASNAPPTFKIDPIDGTITWDAPGSAGEYNIAFEILEWRKIAGEWVRMGFVRRDMQIIIEECTNKRPDLIIPKDVCVEAGTTLNATIFGLDPDNDEVKIEAFSEIFGLSAAQFPASYTPKTDPPTWQVPPAELDFTWNTDCSHVKEQPYHVVFKITDKGKPNLVTFKTWLIRVVGPEPEWVSATTDLTDRSVDLEWEEYFCKNASRMQIWRRVDSLAFEPDSCETGMPEHLGYTMIDEILLTQSGTPVTTYTDYNDGEGLAPGASYCYRLVAIYPAPRGGESYVSAEVCVPAIRADAAIITNVTVDRTSKTDGRITVRWVPPFDLDPAQFPPPYTYRVARAEGFSGDAGLTLLPDADTTDLVIVDEGLNTEEKVYNYRIYARTANLLKLDTSAVASSVRLEAQSQVNRIQLTWDADVPWSIHTDYKHLVYRKDDNENSVPITPDQLTLLSEVDVTETGLIFTDGETTPLQTGKLYCYVVETLGTYGNENPLLLSKEPLRNFSQIICTQPGDSLPPCKPVTPVAFNAKDCRTYVDDEENCSNSLSTSNILTWTRPDGVECSDDVAYYKIYVSPTSEDEFVVLVDQNLEEIHVRDTFFVHANLPSYAVCYKISAVDRSGNESELSDAVCFDNCPYYELPNVFTPNGDNCNDLFSAFSDRQFGGEGGNFNDCEVAPADKKKCARFVKAVTLTVYNRWGKEIYSYESGGERTIYIDWNGKDGTGTDVSAGIYFYIAEVTFETSDPKKRHKTYKGWVHLIR
jgi:hypothetical protein